MIVAIEIFTFLVAVVGGLYSWVPFNIFCGLLFPKMVLLPIGKGGVARMARGLMRLMISMRSGQYYC